MCSLNFCEDDLSLRDSWARAEGCPWDEQTCKFATFRGHLALLKWAISAGCPYDSAVIRETCPKIAPWLNDWESLEEKEPNRE